jgi:hypothetical protein
VRRSFSRKGRAGIAALLTSFLGVVIAGFRSEGPVSIPQLLVGSLLFVGIPAVIGIYAVMMPVEAWACRHSNRLAPLAVVGSNVALVTIVYGSFSLLGGGRFVLATPAYVLFAIAAAVIWLASDRMFQKANANG